MLKQLTIVKLACLCLICGLALWLAYGVIWQIRVDTTTPFIYTSNGYIVERTPGTYILITLILGVIFSPLSALASSIISLAYIVTKIPMKSILSYKFSKKETLLLVGLSIFFNILVMIIFNILIVKSIP